ncbi:UDP-N-acetylglucosamine transporter ROCK1-like [Miscanthus floridulus]|uniref:UDP-N-acetylglucosamine transporter ROCK1-like n=1 Tax=Miscanthus floridulus TaxID=154761 RepID=UPI003457E4B3
MGSSSTPAAAAAAAPSRRKVALYLALLTLQYGAQPLISKRFVRQDTIVTSLVLATEAAKVICAIILLIAEGSLKKQFSNWTLSGSLTASGLPAAIYALQNSLLQVSYKNLDSLTFSILNQTKLLWTAFFTFLILGQKQSSRQILALALLIGAAVLLSVGESSSKGSKGGGSDYILLYGIIHLKLLHTLYHIINSLIKQLPALSSLISFCNIADKGLVIVSPALISLIATSCRQKQSSRQILALALLIGAAVLLSVGESSSKGSKGGGSDYILLYGIIPVTVASMLSGLASSLCQWASQVKKHTSYMMTIEMSFIGSTCLLASTYQSPDGEAIRKYGFFHEWTFWTVVPVLMNAVGGILVGLVTTYAGGVRKGFVIVSALLVTALLQFVFDGKPPSLYCLMALPLVATSIFIYQKYPYVDRKKKD